MTASVDNRSCSGDGAHLARDEFGTSFNGPLKGGQILKVGCLVGELFSDTANPPLQYDYVADGTMRCIGFCSLGADGTGLADNARPTRVRAETGVLIDKNAGGGNAIVAKDKYKPAYGVDNQTCSKLSSDGPIIGLITGIDRASGKPVVIADAALARMLSLLPTVSFRPIKNVQGHNNAGACTATGAKVGDVVLMVSFAKAPTAAAATQAGLTAFESTITVADQIQQTGTANLSSDFFDVLLLAQS